MKILVGCEESQAVTIELRKLGHEAYSCDLIESSGGHPEYHLQMDVFDAIDLKEWDMGIFFPTCTYLTVSANKWYKDQPKRKSGTLVGAERRAAIRAARIAKRRRKDEARAAARARKIAADRARRASRGGPIKNNIIF